MKINNKLNKVKYSIIASFLMLSFGSIANEENIEINNIEREKKESYEALERIEKDLEIANRKNLNTSLQKSQYRNEISELTLQEQLLARQINVRNRLMDLRRLDYMLDLPIEAHLDMTEFNLPEKKDKTEPRIQDHSLGLREYRPSAYQADQLIFRERDNKEEKSKEENFQQKDRNEESATRRRSSEEEVERARTLPQIPKIQAPSAPQRVQSEQSLEDINRLTDEELEVLGISREEYQNWIKEDSGSSLENAPLNGANGQSIDSSDSQDGIIEIRKLLVNNIFIFGENRKANLSIEYYNSGRLESVDYRNLEQGDIINYDGYRMRVNRISKEDVQLVNENTGETKSGTSIRR